MSYTDIVEKFIDTYGDANFFLSVYGKNPILHPAPVGFPVFETDVEIEDSLPAPVDFTKFEEMFRDGFEGDIDNPEIDINVIGIESGLLVDSCEIDTDKVIANTMKPKLADNFNDNLHADIIQVKSICQNIERVLDFGSGTTRCVASYFPIYIHVDFKCVPGTCLCGAEIYTILDESVQGYYDTFLAINSLQNNTLCDQRAILKKQKKKGVRVIVFQPLKVNSDEGDVRLVFADVFPTGKWFCGRSSMIFIWDKNLVEYDQTQIVRGNEPLVNKFGMVSYRGNPNLRSVVLVAQDRGRPLVVMHKDMKAADFLVAGHMRYGETPLEAIRREIKEEMSQDITNLLFVGLIEPLGTSHQVFVYYSNDIYSVGEEPYKLKKCAPLRGFVTQVKMGMRLRDDYCPALMVCKQAGLISYDVENLYFASKRAGYSSFAESKMAKHEKLTEQYYYQMVDSDVVVHLPCMVSQGTLIRCSGPRIVHFKPLRVRLFCGGVQIGVAFRYLNPENRQICGGYLYVVKEIIHNDMRRVWCVSRKHMIFLPVTRSAANLLAELYEVSAAEAFILLLNSRGKINHELMLKNCYIPKFQMITSKEVNKYQEFQVTNAALTRPKFLGEEQKLSAMKDVFISDDDLENSANDYKQELVRQNLEIKCQKCDVVVEFGGNAPIREEGNQKDVWCFSCLQFNRKNYHKRRLKWVPRKK